MATQGQGRFVGKVVVVTGASAGIGAASAKAFSKEGATVALVARTENTLEQVANGIRGAGGRALVVTADVSDLSAHGTWLDRIAQELGGIDVLINNAGANHRGVVEERNVDEMAHVITVNLTAPITLARAVLPYLRKRGGGAIVNVASLAGRVPVAGNATYSATKAGLRAFSFALAEELAGSSIHVSVASPGPVDTGFIMNDLDNVPDLVFSQPLVTSEQVAAMVLDCALGGPRERTPSFMSSLTTHIGYLFPRVRLQMQPWLEKKGRAAKARLRRDAQSQRRLT